MKTLSSTLLLGITLTTVNAEQLSIPTQQDYQQQHESLMPVVAVADMFFGCNRTMKTDDYDYRVDDLVKDMDKELLAAKLMTCLDGADLASDTAINYGLYGCFHEQMKSLNQEQYNKKMDKLLALLKTLPIEQKQKSFTQCVSDQTVSYLK